jgi:hypothetical protein
VAASQGEKVFSAERALIFLNEIAKEPHAGGTRAHDLVRDYIVNYCRQMGLETNLVNQTGMVPVFVVNKCGSYAERICKVERDRFWQSYPCDGPL